MTYTYHSSIYAGRPVGLPTEHYKKGVQVYISLFRITAANFVFKEKANSFQSAFDFDKKKFNIQDNVVKLLQGIGRYQDLRGKNITCDR